MKHFHPTHPEPDLLSMRAVIIALAMAFVIGVLGVYVFDAGLVKMQLARATDLPAPQAAVSLAANTQ